jgi:hypothetical protein
MITILKQFVLLAKTVFNQKEEEAEPDEKPARETNNCIQINCKSPEVIIEKTNNVLNEYKYLVKFRLTFSCF